MQGFGYFARQHDQQAVTGYDADIGGAMIAWDAPIGTSSTAGFGVGYAGSTIHANNASARTTVESFQVTGYFSHEPGPWFFNAALSASANTYKGTRQIVFTGVNREASANYHGQAYTAFATTGFHLPVGRMTITPLASLLFSRVEIGRYAETGANDIDLQVKARRYDFAESALGVKIARAYPIGKGSFVPEAHVKWLHELSNPKLVQSASFAVPGSQSFDVPGLKTASDMWNVGAGFILASCGCTTHAWSLEAGYDYYRANSGYSAHQGTIKLSARF